MAIAVSPQNALTTNPRDAMDAAIHRTGAGSTPSTLPPAGLGQVAQALGGSLWRDVVGERAHS